MKLYFYRAKLKSKDEFGFKRALNKNHLIKILQKKNMRDIKARKILNGPKFASDSEILRFSQQMHKMIGNGITSKKALQLYLDLADEDFANLLTEVYDDSEAGYSLSNSFKRTEYFPPIFVNTIAMGEQTSTLKDSFLYIKDFYEREKNIKKKTKNILTYPIVLLVLIFIVIIVMSVFIMPQFKSMYDGFSGKLPIVTQIYMRLGKYFLSGWYFILLSVGLMIGGYKTYCKNSLHIKNLDRFKLHIPMIAGIYKKILTARFSNVMSLYVSSGLKLQTAIASSANILDNSSLKKDFDTAIKKLNEGRPINECLSSIEIFPKFYKLVIAIAESSGTLSESFNELSKTMDDEANEAINSVSVTIQPIVVIVMAAVIVPTILAILMPMYSVSNVMQM